VPLGKSDGSQTQKEVVDRPLLLCQLNSHRLPTLTGGLLQPHTMLTDVTSFFSPCFEYVELIDGLLSKVILYAGQLRRNTWSSHQVPGDKLGSPLSSTFRTSRKAARLLAQSCLLWSQMPLQLLTTRAAPERGQSTWRIRIVARTTVGRP
jgi:hypothetical protein